MSPTPLSLYLPFNRDCLRGAFEPAKRGEAPGSTTGHWLIVQDQHLLIPEGDTICLPPSLPETLKVSVECVYQPCCPSGGDATVSDTPAGGVGSSIVTVAE